MQLGRVSTHVFQPNVHYVFLRNLNRWSKLSSSVVQQIYSAAFYSRISRRLRNFHLERCPVTYIYEQLESRCTQFIRSMWLLFSVIIYY